MMMDYVSNNVDCKHCYKGMNKWPVNSNKINIRLNKTSFLRNNYGHY